MCCALCCRCAHYDLVFVLVCPTALTQATIRGASQPRVYLAPQFGDGFWPEFWFLRVVHDRKLANMEITTVTTTDSTVEIQCAKNYKAIKVGCELVLFKAAPEKRARETCPAVVLVEPIGKRAKRE